MFKGTWLTLKAYATPYTEGKEELSVFEQFHECHLQKEGRPGKALLVQLVFSTGLNMYLIIIIIIVIGWENKCLSSNSKHQQLQSVTSSSSADEQEMQGTIRKADIIIRKLITVGLISGEPDQVAAVSLISHWSERNNNLHITMLSWSQATEFGPCLPESHH